MTFHRSREEREHDARMRRLMWRALIPLLIPLGAVTVLALVTLLVR